MGTASVHPGPAGALAGEGSSPDTFLNQITNSSPGNDVKCKVAPLHDWFSWCQSCRHGGHLEHMNQWFDQHDECPVTGCTCHCDAKDIVEIASPIESTEERYLN